MAIHFTSILLRMTEAVAASSLDAKLERIATQFFSTETDGMPSVPNHRCVNALSPLIQSSRDSVALTGFEACLVCVRDWNADLPGPCFRASAPIDDRIIDTLSVSVTTLASTTYGIKTTGYLYDGASGAFFGMIDLRYFGDGMPRTLTFDLAAHRIAVSTRIEVRFAVDGGGTPHIPKPPTVNSVSLRLVAR